MTVILAALTLTMSLLLGTFFGQLGTVVATRVRAQLAADAAALAAVAESAPYGRGLATSVARRYAELNGGELIECDCVAGSEAVQVEVDVDGVRATARAVVDPTLFGPAMIGLDADGLHPRLARAVDELLRAGGGSVRMVSGWRSPAEQRVLWSNALAKYGSAELADDWVAPPGRSMHEAGLAVDLGGDLETAARLVSVLGLPLYRPLPNEPWHFELVGSRR
jgi:D-alanyl-D-alanine carboxypeptidase/Putative Flp pilus-assembly TadE/G-like